MLSNLTNLGRITPIHTDFGNNTSDLLVVEYDVPQTKIKQTLFYKYGQLSIPKWALIPIGIISFGLLTALCAIIVNSILSQSIGSVTYSQTCSKTSKCNSTFGLICGSQSKCVCEKTKYWYEDNCVTKPTYTEQCNQTTECRTDLGLICAEIEGNCNCPNTTLIQTCDCPSTSYWTGSTCTSRLSYLGTCSIPDISYQCLSNLYCNGTKCICQPNKQYWNSTANQCYSIDKYRDLCDPLTSYTCDASVSLHCLSAGEGSQCPYNVTIGTTSCDCLNGTYWNGGSCVTKKSFNQSCFWNCECNSDVGLECLNMTCVCPKKSYWSVSSCELQKNYTQPSCNNTNECDTTQGLTCYLPSATACNCPINSVHYTCDCLTTQFYDYSLSSCQKLHLYNETCLGDYMCDHTLGLFCQLSINSVMNCSCPEPIRLNMCDCNMSSYWDGVTCTPRLAPNISCSFEYQCEIGFTCIVNETDIGVFSDVCRCPLNSYYVSGPGCVPSKNYEQSCEGSYQCYESAPLSCRYNDTGLTCLDTDTYSLPVCDCSDYYYYNSTSMLCVPLLNRFGICSLDCHCTPPYRCVSGKCDCASYYSSISQTCVEFLSFGDNCSTTAQCNATPNALMSCISSKCACDSSGFWDGTQCKSSINFRSLCANDNNCYKGLKCRQISCIDSQKRCSCDDDSYFSFTSQNCTPCKNTYSNYERVVINYPNSDICVGVLWPGSSTSITFATADSNCNNLAPMALSAGIPQLLSVHNQSELNCIASILRDEEDNKKCSNNRFYYLGFSQQNMTFYDGTPYSPAFTSPTVGVSQCLTYCYNNDKTGTLNARSCSDTVTSGKYGGICDYRVL